MESDYQVIARRWRPQQFDEVAGQDHIVRTLKNAIRQNRIAHAYLFIGPRGTGKTSTARVFAKALNCENGPMENPPADSQICRDIMEGSCMDVIEIDGASNNSVDQVRQLREDCQYAPAQCRFKIYIIDEVHMLSASAFNALLKTLEEPPAHVKFIFATTEAQKLLPTIISRCQRFEFRPIDDHVIVERIAIIAKAEKIKIDKKALASIARLANGSLRDAQSILDQMISFCGETVGENDILDVYGLAPPERIDALAKAIATADYKKLIQLADELTTEGRDLYHVLLDLQVRVREGLIDAIRNDGQTSKLGSVLSTEALMRMLDALHAGESAVQKGLSQKINFEVTLLKAVEQSRARAIDSLIKELTRVAENLPQKTTKKKIVESPVSERAKHPETQAAEPAEDNFIQVDDKSSGLVEETAPAPKLPPKEKNPLPDLDDLVAKIPKSIRDALEENLNGRFRTVRRIDKKQLH